MGFDYVRYFDEVALTHDLITRADERSWRLGAPGASPEPHRIVLYLGCNVLRTAHLVQTVTALFDRLGLDYVAVGGVRYCCGIVHHQHGHPEAGGGMGTHSLRLIERAYAPEEVVMWCPSCIYYYDEVLGARLPFRVRHTTEFLVDQLPALRFTAPARGTVALHAHAEGEARQREARACRQLLQAVPGLRYIGVPPEPRFGRSCAPTVAAALGQEMWDGLARDEIERARAGGAEILATIYHGCQRMLCGFEGEGRITVEHYLTVFARALGVEFEDVYKKYRLSGDPERILDDMAPYQQANGVDPARARQLVLGTFPARPRGPRPA